MECQIGGLRVSDADVDNAFGGDVKGYPRDVLIRVNFL